ncbi:MAG TPA: preprotein translocase subunit YajC [Blastocatellia bacterium]|jgi:preprotein translocase subunit YajC|nr:preprotein translocase subunit YajC [Blastocatellia bacterium]
MSQQIAVFLFQQASPLVTFIPLLLVFVLFYFLIIVPQRKRQRAVDSMLDNLKTGDKVVTQGGIYGTVVSIRDDKRTMQLKISENPVVRVEVARTAISGLQDTPAEEKK